MHFPPPSSYDQIYHESPTPFSSKPKNSFFSFVSAPLRKAGIIIGRLILSAQAKPKHVLQLPAHVRHIQLVATSEIALDTIEITPETRVSNEIILYFMGSGRPYEEVFEELCADANDLQRKVVAFNYQGVGYSTGIATSAQDLVNNGLSQVHRLQATYPDAKIILRGLSLGGAIALLVAEKTYLPIFNINSFSTLTHVIVGGIRASKPDGHSESAIGIALGWICFPVVKALLAVTSWSIDAIAAYKKLHTTHKAQMGHMCLRSPKDLRRQGIRDDDTITHFASLHEQTKSLQDKSERQLCKMSVVEAQRGDPNVDPHILNVRHVTNRDGQNGLQFFQRFLEKSRQSTMLQTPQALTP